MKTLKTMILGFVALLTFGAANAKSTNPVAEKFSVNYAVTMYINAVTHGQSKGLAEVLDDNVKFTMKRGTTTLSYDKSQLLDFFKSTENIEQNCKTTFSTNEANPDMTVVTVEMQYKDFTRTNYVTISNSSDGWKITNIYSVFK